MCLSCVEMQLSVVFFSHREAFYSGLFCFYEYGNKYATPVHQSWFYMGELLASFSVQICFHLKCVS